MPTIEEAHLLLSERAFNVSGAIGGIISRHLTESGLLPNHVEFHLQTLPASERAESFAHAVKVALKIEEGEMPDWALSGHPLPGVLELNPNLEPSEKTKILDELGGDYYSMGMLITTLDGQSNTYEWSRRVRSISHTTWSRLLQQVHPRTREQIEFLRQFRTQEDADEVRIDLRRARAIIIRNKLISDEILYGLMANNLVGLQSRMKGVGEVAVLGVGAMLLQGGHEDMLPFAEKLADYQAEHDRHDRIPPDSTVWH